MVGVHRQTVHRWAQSGRIPVKVMISNQPRYERGEITRGILSGTFPDPPGTYHNNCMHKASNEYRRRRHQSMLAKQALDALKRKLRK